MADLTLRQRTTCGKCGEVHTNDNLNLYFTPGDDGEPRRVCFFCDHGTEVGTKDGTMGHKPGEKVPTVTREQDRLEAEALIAEVEGRGYTNG